MFFLKKRNSCFEEKLNTVSIFETVFPWGFMRPVRIYIYYFTEENDENE
jgi:hypothetical protein